MSNCIFCKIVNNEIPSIKVYEDADFLAFLDISPVNHGHTLIIPKKHFANLQETPAEVLAGLMKIVLKITPAILQATSAPAFNLTVNNGHEAGQIIDHTHFHIIPRFVEDGLKMWEHQGYGTGEMEELGEKIRQSQK